MDDIMENKGRDAPLWYRAEEAALPAQMEAKLSESPVLAHAGRSGKPGGKIVSDMLSHFSKVKTGLSVTERSGRGRPSATASLCGKR